MTNNVADKIKVFTTGYYDLNKYVTVKYSINIYTECLNDLIIILTNAGTLINLDYNTIYLGNVNNIINRYTARNLIEICFHGSRFLVTNAGIPAAYHCAYGFFQSVSKSSTVLCRFILISKKI